MAYFNSKHEKNMLLFELPQPILLYNILPYLVNDHKTLGNLLVSSKQFQSLLLSKEYSSHIWNPDLLRYNRKVYKVCIDSYCTQCHFKSLKASLSSAISFLSKYPINRYEIHCFVTDIPACLNSLSILGTIQYLDLTLSNKSNSPPLLDLLSSFQEKQQILNDRNNSSIDMINSSQENILDRSYPSIEYPFKTLKELILDSSHLKKVNLDGRAKLLEIIGKSLLKLSFRNLSPSYVFSIISNTTCPDLISLSVDYAKTLPDLISYQSNQLIELNLRRSNFVLPLSLAESLPALKKLYYSAFFRLELSQIQVIIQSLPMTLSELSIEIPSALADGTLLAISKKLTQLQKLSIEGSHERGKISKNPLKKLGNRCQNLQELHIISAKSVDAIGFDSIQAFIVLGQDFPNLLSIRVMYEEYASMGLHNILSHYISPIREVIFWQRKRWMEASHWEIMEVTLLELRNLFPHVIIGFEDP
eukprot:gene8150-11031_t